MSLQSATARVAEIQARIGAIPRRVQARTEFQGVLNDVQRLTGVSPQDADPVATDLTDIAANLQGSGLGAEQNALIARLTSAQPQSLGSMVSGGQDLAQILSQMGLANTTIARQPTSNLAPILAQPAVTATQGGDFNSGSNPGAAVLEGYEIGSGFGSRIHPITKTRRFHSGVDIGAPSGTPITAFDDGVVTFAGPKGGYGNLVTIDHGNGVETRYAHQSQVGVAAGDQIKAGETLGYVGSTGNSTGPHLHFERREQGSAVDPTPYLQATGMTVGKKH
jgi:murein DD-endopeptidase MepM/ murein hydrolase activator NlpD